MLGLSGIFFWIYHRYVLLPEKTVARLEEKTRQAGDNLDKVRRNYQQIEVLWGCAFKSFCALDTETTGIKKASSKDIQVALVLFDEGKPAGKRIWYIDPEVPIPSNASKVNAIYDTDVNGKGNFRYHAPQLKELLERYPLVGHNLYFDVTMLESEFKRIGQGLKIRPLYCTMRNTWYDAAIAPPVERRLRKGADALSWQTLESLASSLGVVPTGQLHDAGVDARLAGECFVALAEEKLSPIRKRLQQAEAEYN